MLERAVRDSIKLERAIIDYGHAELALGRDLLTFGPAKTYLTDKTLHQCDRAKLARQSVKAASQATGH
jgi:hypothetical protein